MKSFLLSIFFCYCSILVSVAQNSYVSNNSIVELKEWEVYDKSQEVNIPYMFSYHSNYKSVFQDIDLSLYQNFQLQLIGRTEGSVFLGDKLIYSELSGGDTLQILINDLKDINQDLKSSRITFFSTKQDSWYPPSLSIVSDKNITGNFLESENSIRLLNKNTRLSLTSSNTVIYLLSLWVVFAFYVYFITKDFSLTYVSSPWLVWLRYKSNEEDTSIIEILFFTLIYCFTIEFFLSNRVDFVESSPYFQKLFSQFQSSGSYVSQHFNLATLLFFWMMIRFLMIGLIGVLYQIKQLSTLYLREWHRFSMGYIFILLLVVSTLHFLGWQINVGLQLLFWLSLLFKAVLIVAYINRTFKLKKVYLFSYFCTSELIPILLGMKFFIDF